MPDDPCRECRVDQSVAPDVHLPTCPHRTGMWPSHGDERCEDCKVGFEIGDFYTHVTEGKHDILVCLSCGAYAAIGQRVGQDTEEDAA